MVKVLYPNSILFLYLPLSSSQIEISPVQSNWTKGRSVEATDIHERNLCLPHSAFWTHLLHSWTPLPRIQSSFLILSFFISTPAPTFAYRLSQLLVVTVWVRMLLWRGQVCLEKPGIMVWDFKMNSRIITHPKFYYLQIPYKLYYSILLI